jgi:hypothetical protein
MTSKNTTEPSKKIHYNFEESSLGILFESLRNNGITVDFEKFKQLYEIELQLQFNNGYTEAYLDGRTTALYTESEG